MSRIAAQGGKAMPRVAAGQVLQQVIQTGHPFSIFHFWTSPDITNTSVERPIIPLFTKPGWFPIAVALSPAVVLTLLLIVPTSRATTVQVVGQHWGNIASVWGLGVSIYVLFFAKGAKRAAEEARQEGRRRNLAEDLQGAQTKAQEVGQFIRDEEWHAVFLRCQEIASVFSLVLNRWSAELTKDSKTSITRARSQADSIASVAMSADRVKLTERQIVTASASQRRLHELLSEELGESLRVIERSPDPNV